MSGSARLVPRRSAAGVRGCFQETSGNAIQRAEGDEPRLRCVPPSAEWRKAGRWLSIQFINQLRAVFFPKTLYKARARIEQAVGKLKRFKCIALRREKTAQNYGSSVALALGSS